MQASITDKVALITGASRGIGQATALECIRSDARGVVITSRKQDNIEQSRNELVEAGADPDKVLALPARADDADAADEAVKMTIQEFGACDILVNNAGTNPAFGSLMDVDLGALDKTWAVNMRAPLLWARAVYRGRMRESGGVIVNVASVAGLRPSPMMGAYNISKAGLIHLTRQLALELAPDVRVNAVAPGVVRTRLAGALLEDEGATASMHPLGRVGEPEDVASAIVFLASDASSWVTGVTLPVDGGVVGAGSSGIS